MIEKDYVDAICRGEGEVRISRKIRENRKIIKCSVRYLYKDGFRLKNQMGSLYQI